MDPVLERAIAERSELQLGLITDPQLRELGISWRRRQGLLDQHRLVALGGRTYRLPGMPWNHERAVLAACLDLDGVASHRTATGLHVLPTDPWLPLPVEVTVRRGTRAGTSPLAIVHTSTNLPETDIVHIGPIPTTSVARTILGLASLVPDLALEDVREVVDVAIQRRLASDEWLWWLLEKRRCRGRIGVSTLEAILHERSDLGRTESWLERAFLRVVEEGGFQTPIVQRRVRASGAFLARVDAFWEPDVIAEINGAATHTSRRQLSADAVRRNRLIAAGFQVLDFTYDHIVHDVPYVWATLATAGVPHAS